MVLIALFCLVVTTVILLELAIGFIKLPNLADQSTGRDSGSLVSIIVPACNEADKIEASLRSLALQTYENLEIIVVNDRSTDQTGEVIDRVAREFSQIARIDVETLPEGWLGKPHALQQGSNAASGEFLVFIDADVLLDPITIARAVAAMQQSHLDHLSLVFKNSTTGGLLNAIVADIGVCLLWVMKPWNARIKGSRYFVGVGAFSMVRAEVYEQIGRHERVRMQVIDDLFLGKLIKRGGYRQDCLDGRGLIAVPWYESVSELVSGLMKNVFAFFNYRTSYMIIGVSALTLLVYLPYWGVLFCEDTARILFMATIGVRVMGIGIGLISSGIEKRALLWLPVTPFVMLYIIIKAAWVTQAQGGISWRGSFYPLSELKKEEWVLSGLFPFTR